MKATIIKYLRERRQRRIAAEVKGAAGGEIPLTRTTSRAASVHESMYSNRVSFIRRAARKVGFGGNVKMSGKGVFHTGYSSYLCLRCDRRRTTTLQQHAGSTGWSDFGSQSQSHPIDNATHLIFIHPYTHRRCAQLLYCVMIPIMSFTLSFIFVMPRFVSIVTVPLHHYPYASHVFPVTLHSLKTAASRSSMYVFTLVK